MGKHFGNLQKLTGVYYYTLSPMELNPMTMMVKGLKNAVRKGLRAASLGAVPILASISTYYWASTTYEKLQRKDPELYKNDV